MPRQQYIQSVSIEIKQKIQKMNLKHSNIRLLKNPILKPIANALKNQNLSPLNSRVNEEQSQRNQTKRSQKFCIKDPSIDPRDIKLNISSSELDNLFTNDFSDTQRTILRRWLVDVYESICSDAFNKYHHGQLTESQVKAYAAKNIIFNIDIIFLKIGHQVSQQSRREIMRFINKQSEQIFKQIIIKYPQTSVRETYRKLKHKISKIDVRQTQTYDLIRYCDDKIEFKYNEKQDYISQIMSFINYLINLSSSPIPGESSSQFTMFQGFQLILETLVYFDDEGHNFQGILNQYLQKHIDFSIDTFRIFFEGYHSLNNQKTRKLKMNQKIHPSVLAFTRQEIKQGEFRILDSPILRIMDKWVEQLEQKLKNIRALCGDSSSKFKLHNGEQSQLNQESIINLMLKCQQHWEKVSSYQDQIKKSLIAMQQTLFNQRYQGKYINNIDTNVGIIAARTQSCIGQYMLQYLNKIIAALLLVPKQIAADKMRNTQKQMEELNLITFKVGDIMRARCSASQQAIASIFKSMQLLSQKLPKVFKLIRVKDRLEKKDNDILINFFFMNKLQCQIQFSVTSGSTDQKQQHLNSFNHFLYELSRAKFGSIAECACIATHYDPLSKSFALRKKIMPEIIFKQAQHSITSKFELFPEQKRTKLISQSAQIKKNKMNVFPFFCSVCKVYIKNNDPFSFSQKLHTPQYKQCTQCFINRLLQQNQQQFIVKMLQQKFKDQNQKQFIKKHITLLNGKVQTFKKKCFLIVAEESSQEEEIGIIAGFAKKKSKKSQLFYYKITYTHDLRKNSKFLFIRFQNGKMEKFYEIQFKVNHNAQEQQDLIVFNDQQIQKLFNQYLLFSLSSKNHQSFNLLRNEKLEQNQKEQLEENNNQVNMADGQIAKNRVKSQFMRDTLQCKECKMKTIQLATYKGDYNKMALKLENLRQLNQTIEKQKESYQGIRKQFTDEFNTIPVCKFLKIVKLNHNSITDISFVRKLPNLERIQIQYNKVTNLPDFSGNKNLKYIICSDNPIKSLLPMKDLSSLLTLKVDNTDIQNFKGLQNCKNLRQLKAESSINLKTLDGLQLCQKLAMLVQTLEKLKDCTQIEKLKLTSLSKLRCIKDLKNMSELTHLNIFVSSLNILQGIQDCFNLKQIKITHSPLKSLQPISKLLKLEQLQINHCQLQSFDVTGKLNLKSIEVFKNKIKSLQGIQMFPELEWLRVTHNKISSLLPINKLTKLKTLIANTNKIEYLKQIGPMKSLQRIQLLVNPLKSLAGIEEMTSLQYVSVPNQLQSFQQLKNLSQLKQINKKNPQNFFKDIENRNNSKQQKKQNQDTAHIQFFLQN